MIQISKNNYIFTVTSSHHEGMWTLLQEGQWEPESFQILDRFLKPDDVVIDVGAWIGPLSLYAAHRVKQVYSLEPDPVAFQELKANLLLNPQLPITAIPLALDAQNGRKPLYIRTFPGCSGSSLAHPGSGKSVNVSTSTIESLLSKFKIPKVDFMKIDTEGAEFELIPAMRSFLSEHQPTLYLSLHAPLLPNFRPEWMERLIQSLECYRYFYFVYGKPFEPTLLMNSFWSEDCRAFVASNEIW